MKTDEQQIRDLVATWMQATQAGDVDTVLGLMTDDVVSRPASLFGGVPPGKRQAITRTLIVE